MLWLLKLRHVQSQNHGLLVVSQLKKHHDIAHQVAASSDALHVDQALNLL